MTDQELFDKVAKHLLTQGEQAKENEGNRMCLYCTTEGLKCAVGCLIADDLYDPDIERTSVHGILTGSKSPGQGNHTKLHEILGKCGIDYAQYPLLVELQDLHDYQDVGCWRDALKRVAKRHHLKDTVLC